MEKNNIFMLLTRKKICAIIILKIPLRVDLNCFELKKR